jgi:hypothetical protein
MDATQPHRNELCPTVLGQRRSAAQNVPRISVGTPVTMAAWGLMWKRLLNTAATTEASAKPTAATFSHLRTRSDWKEAGTTRAA